MKIQVSLTLYSCHLLYCIYMFFSQPLTALCGLFVYCSIHPSSRTEWRGRPEDFGGPEKDLVCTIKTHSLHPTKWTHRHTCKMEMDKLFRNKWWLFMLSLIPSKIENGFNLERKQFSKFCSEGDYLTFTIPLRWANKQWKNNFKWKGLRLDCHFDITLDLENIRIGIYWQIFVHLSVKK